MNRRVDFLIPLALVLPLALGLTACGRVGDPLPPVVEIPETVSNFSVSQVARTLRFAWTNPSRNVDSTPATNLDRAVIFAEAGDVFLDVPVSGPGESQVETVDVRGMVGETRAFSIRVETDRGRASEVSGAVSVSIVEVPGAATGLTALVDQGRVALTWIPPGEGAALVAAYRISRSGAVIGESGGTDLLFEDETYVVGATYDYVVTPLRQATPGPVEGLASAPVRVLAIDRTAPSAPLGLVSRPLEAGVLLTWEANGETDVVGYRIFRADTSDGPFLTLTEEPLVSTGYNEVDSVPGRAYRVTALDRSGNESPPSATLVAGP